MYQIILKEFEKENIDDQNEDEKKENEVRLDPDVDNAWMIKAEDVNFLID